MGYEVIDDTNDTYECAIKLESQYLNLDLGKVEYQTSLTPIVDDI